MRRACSEDLLPAAAGVLRRVAAHTSSPRTLPFSSHLIVATSRWRRRVRCAAAAAATGCRHARAAEPDGVVTAGCQPGRTVRQKKPPTQRCQRRPHESRAARQHLLPPPPQRPGVTAVRDVPAPLSARAGRRRSSWSRGAPFTAKRRRQWAGRRWRGAPPSGRIRFPPCCCYCAVGRHVSATLSRTAR